MRVSDEKMEIVAKMVNAFCVHDPDNTMIPLRDEIVEIIKASSPWRPISEVPVDMEVELFYPADGKDKAMRVVKVYNPHSSSIFEPRQKPTHFRFVDDDPKV